MERVVDVCRGNHLHTFQHLDTALGLFGFGGFGLKAIDKALQMRHPLLLAFVHRLLLGESHRALALKRAVVAGVFEHRLLFDMNNFVYHRVEEITVVRDQDQRALIALQPLLQPDDGIQIEVVSRFIEQQQIGAADQRLGQVKTHAPATGEVADRTFQLFIAETQTVQKRGGAGADSPGVDGVEFAVDGGNRVAIVAFVGGIKFSFQFAVLPVAVNNIVHCRYAQRGRLLVHPGQLPVARVGKVTAVGTDLVFQQ